MKSLTLRALDVTGPLVGTRLRLAEVSAHQAVNSRRATMEVIASHFPVAGGAAPQDDQGLEVSFWKTLELDRRTSHHSS
jgi:hypothetical protein